uniref:Uncharacterized protein n=1 Tax=Pristionchus pacificus TaxID=54126 RepID=A0A2A6C003_PRIPA|eukprot:PDM71582.1 hypothetical protein PRIPAC_37989 [Pristionchus pacificus]
MRKKPLEMRMASQGKVSQFLKFDKRDLNRNLNDKNDKGERSRLISDSTSQMFFVRCWVRSPQSLL